MQMGVSSDFMALGIGSIPPLFYFSLILDVGITSYNMYLYYMKTRRPRLQRKRKTIRLYSYYAGSQGGIKPSIQTISGKREESKEGWKIAHIWGGPYERGYAHGYLFRLELEEVFRVFPFMIQMDLNTTFQEYVGVSNQWIYPIVKRDFPEYYEEIRGIAAGYSANRQNAGGAEKITVKQLIAWNAYMSLTSLYKEGGERCSAFIATGDSTKSGKIVMGHNTHSDLVSAALFNIILKITPKKGNTFRMQTAAGLISSITDWFVCENGLIGCESTIHGIRYRPEFGPKGYPSFCRIRKAMQYAKGLDDFTKIMLYRNAGDYACSWLLGDIRTGEIMRFEMGLKYSDVERTKNGIFYGMNNAVDYQIRTLETEDTGTTDTATSSGSRSYRLHHLLTAERLDEEAAKRILADHYDESLNATRMGYRTICRHSELDGSTRGNTKPFFPFGTHDGKVVTSEMAQRGEFVGIWGSACGRLFDTKAFLRDHPEYKEYEPFLASFPKRGWVSL
jgi:hypothetical protein